MCEKTNIRVELTLCFDNDYDVYKISPEIGIPYDEIKRRSETRVNPLTGQKNCGYWTVSTEAIQTFDAEIPVEILVRKIQDQLDNIKKILSENDGEAIFRLTIEVENNETPAIRFQQDFLKIVQKLDASIDVIVLIL